MRVKHPLTLKFVKETPVSDRREKEKETWEEIRCKAVALL